MDWDSHKNQLPLCGREPANGFELWRRLIANNRGGGVAVRMAGVKALNSFPQYTYLASIGQHLDAWEDLFTEFGAALDSTPDQLVIVFKEKLPASIITDLLDHPDVVAYEDILKFCRRRTDHRKENDLCDQAKKRILARTRRHAMPVVGQQPEIDASGAHPDAAVDKSSTGDWRYEHAQATCKS